MTEKRRRRGLFRVLIGFALALVLLAGSALPGLAASEATQNVLDQLAYLQRVQIEAEWLPDIRANESAVQALLDSYLGLTLAERRELTDQNRADLRAYFEALFEVQGRDTAEVAALFEDATAPGGETQDPSAPQEASVSEAATPAPAPSALEEDASLAAPAVQPSQPSGDDGLLTLFGSRALGTVLLMALGVLAAALFIRFLVALRRTEREGAAQTYADARAQEMFGESYDPVDDPVSRDFIAPPPADFLDTAPAPLPERDAPKGEGFSMFAPENTPGAAKRESFLARRKREKAEREAEASLAGEAPRKGEEQPRPEEKNPSGPFDPSGGPSRFDRAFGGAGLPSAASPSDKTEALYEPAPLPKEAEKLFTANPDRRNSITTRSFSAATRTGRPAKMPFRQGDPDDLDGVDE